MHSICRTASHSKSVKNGIVSALDTSFLVFTVNYRCLDGKVPLRTISFHPSKPTVEGNAFSHSHYWVFLRMIRP